SMASPVSPAPAPSGGGGAGGELPPASILTMNTPGGHTTLIQSDGILLQSLVVADYGGNIILELDSGTEILATDGRVPENLVVNVSEEPPAMPEGFAAISPVYNFMSYTSGGVPRPVTFDPPITLEINYNPEELPENVQSIFIAYYDKEEGWTQLEPPSGFVATVGTAGAQVSHFTPFAVMADLSALPALFEVRNLDINPIQVTAGESVTISAQLFNIGGLRGEHNLMVNIEGLLDTIQVIRLTPGQSQVITFSVTPSSPGSYQVAVGDSRGTFGVEAILIEPPAGVTVSGWLIAVISAVAVIAALAFIAAKKGLQPVQLAAAFTAVRERVQGTAVVEKPPKPAAGAFRVRNLKITPRKVGPDGSVTIIAEATNIGPVMSSYSLVLKIKGIVEAVKETTLDPGQSQKVAFAIFRNKPGVYDVDLEGLKGSFTVEEVASPPDSSLSNR
ncbi:MAG: CARDB domain-containing protein, partial [Dehalococcoidales bacterium]